MIPCDGKTKKVTGMTGVHVMIPHYLNRYKTIKLCKVWTEVISML